MIIYQGKKSEFTEDVIVSTWLQGREVETLHPSYKSWLYVQLLNGFNETIQEEHITLNPCTYLHNYDSGDIINNAFYKDYIDKSPLFLKSDALKLRSFIKKYIKYGDNANILYRIDYGKFKPPKQLIAALSSMLKVNVENYTEI
jgi:hypothetical protein